MKNLALFSIFVVLAAVFFGCPSATPPVEPTIETGKVVVSGNIFDAAADDAKSLSAAGLAQLKWLMAKEVDHIFVEINEEYKSSSVDQAGDFSVEFPEVLTGNYVISLVASGSGFGDLGRLFHVEKRVTIKKGDNLVSLMPEAYLTYPMKIKIFNLPGFYQASGGRPCQLITDDGQAIDCTLVARFQTSSWIMQEVPNDVIVKKIGWIDDNNQEKMIPCNISLLDQIKSTEYDGSIVLDYGERGDVVVDVSFGLQKPPTLSLTTNSDGSFTAVFSPGDFVFCQGEWYPIGYDCDQEPSFRVRYHVDSAGQTGTQDLDLDQPVIFPPYTPYSETDISSVYLEWQKSKYAWVKVCPYDVLVTLDGRMLPSDGERWYLHK